MARQRDVMRLTREQALALRVSKHHLDCRAPASQWLRVVGDIGGLQAQSMNAACLALSERCEGVSSESFNDALLHHRTLVKVYGMRGTVHVLRAEDWPIYFAGLKHAKRGDTLRGRKLPAEAVAEALSLAAGILKAGPLTKSELAAQMPARLRDLLSASGPYPWHALIKDLLESYSVCFGPQRGNEVTFVATERWLSGRGRRISTANAEQELGRRYLGAFAPATAADFAYWSGLPLANARRVFDALAEELVSVEVDGKRAQVFEDDHRRLRTLRSASSVRLLPNFDTYLLGHEDKSQFLDPARRKVVFPGAARVAQTILASGRVVGTWLAKRSGRGLQVTLTPFEVLPGAAKKAIEEEAGALAAFLHLDHSEVVGY